MNKKIPLQNYLFIIKNTTLILLRLLLNFARFETLQLLQRQQRHPQLVLSGERLRHLSQPPLGYLQSRI